MKTYLNILALLTINIISQIQVSSLENSECLCGLNTGETDLWWNIRRISRFEFVDFNQFQ